MTPRTVAIRSKTAEEFDKKLNSVKAAMLSVEAASKQLQDFAVTVRQNYDTVSDAYAALGAPVDTPNTAVVDTEALESFDAATPEILSALRNIDEVAAQLASAASAIRASYIDVERGHSEIMKSYTPDVMLVAADALKYYSDDLNALVKNSMPVIRPIYKNLGTAIAALEGAMLQVEKMRKAAISAK